MLIDALADHPYAALAFAIVATTMAVTALSRALRRLWYATRAWRWHRRARR
jgi:hypothetical protein